MLCNGDTFFDINLFDFRNKLKKDYIGILGCSEIQNRSKRYSLFSYKNKGLVSSGIYLFNRDKIKKFLSGSSSLENEVIKKLPKKNFKKLGIKKIFRYRDTGRPQEVKKILDQTFKKMYFFR